MLGEFTTSPLKLNSDCAEDTDHRRLPIDNPFLDRWTILLVRGLGLILVFVFLSHTPKVQSMRHHQRGIDWPTGRRLPSAGRLSWAPTLAPSSRTLRWSLGTVFRTFTTQKCSYMILSHLTWIPSKMNMKNSTKHA